MKRQIFALFAVLATAPLFVAHADEGLWLFNNFPKELVASKYHFQVTDAFLDHLQLASVRFNNGGSGSFVSPYGLLFTNHHVGLDCIQKLSSAEHDYTANGFYAVDHAAERQCPDLEVNVLLRIRDVTAEVKGAAKDAANAAEANKQRKAAMSQIEKSCTAETGHRCDVVTLYSGGVYNLYEYKKYTDVRLVFAPEMDIAQFGGDPDNFTYPRHDLDFALFRVYENGKPVESHHYLKWNAKGAGDGELVFVSGHPGSTSRLETMTQIETERDYDLPLLLKILNRRVETARRYAAQGPEQARQAARIIFFTENSLKAFKGSAQGLADKNLVAKMQKDEASFRALVASKPEWEKAYGGAWDAVAQAEMKHRQMLKTYRLYSLRWSRLLEIAINIVQYVAEVKKPDGERLKDYHDFQKDYHDSQLDSLRFRLFSPAPIYPGYEAAMLEGALQLSLEELGADDPFIKAVLGARTPAEVAKAAVEGTKLADPAFRKSLVDGGEAAVQASGDPMMGLARTIDPFDRHRIKAFEDNVDSVETPAGEKIGQARFAAYGKSLYPDATFTLRLAYGTVKGYPMNGTQAPPMTTFYGLYDRAYSFGLKPPYNLPARYLERRTRLDLAGPLDFVSTCDIIGGNSGSPVINKQGELVGLIFDGNIESLVGDYVYYEVNNRAVAVHSGAIIEALRELYDASSLADELEGK